MDADNYPVWGLITGILVFVGVWIYAISEWGFLLGIMFGWLPAIIAAFVAGALWPLVAIAIIVLLVIIFW